jgi:hypothetical protein
MQDNSLIKELKNKYDIEEIINKRYNNDKEIIDFYNIYYDEIEKLEEIGFRIWKLFGELWKEEKQEFILNILSLTLLLEKETLKIKKIILNMVNKKKKLKKDQKYLLELIEKNTTEYKFININSSFDDINKLYINSREKLKDNINKEMTRLNENELNENELNENELNENELN